MGKTLADRLDEACEVHGLEWLMLPMDRSAESWRHGPYWGVLVSAQYPRRGGRPSRFYRYDREADPRQERWPDPEVVYITVEPSGRREIKLLLLAQIDGEPCG
jgi:hypothetical protein